MFVLRCSSIRAVCASKVSEARTPRDGQVLTHLLVHYSIYRIPHACARLRDIVDALHVERRYPTAFLSVV
jgi:hypothetical protein